MQHLKKNSIILERGHYLAPRSCAYDFDDFLVGITAYEKPIETGIWHAHEKPMISYVLYGSNLEHRKGAKIKRTRGSMNYYHAYEQHKNTYEVFPSKHISLEINPAFLNKHGYTEQDVALATKRNDNPNLTFINLMSEAIVNDRQSYDAIKMLFLSFLEHSVKSGNRQMHSSWMLTIRDVLNDRWDENVSLRELSDIVHVHPTTISKNFRTFFQCTFGEYTRRLKVNKAMEKLKASSYSLTEIAYICGFSDQSHFTRVFKSMTGFLPKEYVKL